jgi:hypothetical protein
MSHQNPGTQIRFELATLDEVPELTPVMTRAFDDDSRRFRRRKGWPYRLRRWRVLPQVVPAWQGVQGARRRSDLWIVHPVS